VLQIDITKSHFEKSSRSRLHYFKVGKLDFRDGRLRRPCREAETLPERSQGKIPYDLYPVDVAGNIIAAG
jgi:hypothetical protein